MSGFLISLSFLTFSIVFYGSDENVSQLSSSDYLFFFIFIFFLLIIIFDDLTFEFEFRSVNEFSEDH
jgi:hypothetical protein